MSIVTLTINPTIDASTRVKKVVPEKKLRCQRLRHEPGGGGVNVSRAIHKLGGKSTAIYAAGGTTGELLGQLLEREQLTCKVVPVEGMTRESFTVTEEDEAEQFRFVMPGPELSEAEGERCLDVLRSLAERPEYIVASGSLPPGVGTDFYARVADVGRDLGAKVIVDTSGEALRKAVQRGLYLIKPNMREVMDLLGEEEVEDEGRMREAARAMRSDCGCGVVVVSLGAGGALVVSEEGIEHFRTPTVPIRSRVGAGDSMMAGMVLGLDRGWPVREAVRFGIAAGAAAVMTPGTELCRRDDTERIYAEMQKETA